MFTIALICISLALVHSQKTTPAGHTHHPHATHTQHPHATHTQHPHPSHGLHTQHPHTQHPHTQHPHTTHGPHSTPVPITDHTFSSSNPLWFMDVSHHVLVMKTDSGCYGQHMTPEQVTQAHTADGLLKLERGLLTHTEHAKAFIHLHLKGMLSDEIKNSLSYHPKAIA
ncbi:LIM domain-containing protein A-like [Liolophura sinensis]|uniref:LIM domain-containing protein A-like n=1 Tax=Liolophura sinensis TaxID=3198878 RepID=UPI0031587DBF